MKKWNKHESALDTYLYVTIDDLSFNGRTYEIGSLIEYPTADDADRRYRKQCGYVVGDAPILSDIYRERHNDEMDEDAKVMYEVLGDFLDVCKSLPEEMQSPDYEEWCDSFYAPCDDPQSSTVDNVPRLFDVVDPETAALTGKKTAASKPKKPRKKKTQEA